MTLVVGEWKNDHVLGVCDWNVAALRAGFANRSEVAAQEAALAQVQATLPPLQKQLAVQRDLLTALLGRYPNEEPYQRFTLDAVARRHEETYSLARGRSVTQDADARAVITASA